MSNPIIAKLFDENEKLKIRIKELESSAICSYCGTVHYAKPGQEKLDMVIEHMATCEKHPVANLLVEIERLKTELATCEQSALDWAKIAGRNQAQIAKLAGEIEDLKEGKRELVEAGEAIIKELSKFQNIIQYESFSKLKAAVAKHG